MNNQKRNMACNRPRKSWKIGKKKVVKACSRGRQKIIHYGATGYGHNYSSLARKSFRSRHRCSSAKDKLTARYWACKNLWTRGGSVQSCPRNRKCKGISKSSTRRSRSTRRNSTRRSRSTRRYRSTRKKSTRRSRSTRKKSTRRSRSTRRKSTRRSRSTRRKY